MRDSLISCIQQSQNIQTPAFIIDEQQLENDIEIITNAICDTESKLLFAMKSFSIVSGLERIAESVDGLHASSLFEAKLARQILGDKGIVHLTSPGLRSDEIKELSELCDFISFNSISQWEAMQSSLPGSINCGLRINPQLTVVKDKRYDPCRDNSKLGVPLDQLTAMINNSPQQLAGINGLLFHSNCDAKDFSLLLKTVEHIDTYIGHLFNQLSWINLGGGYLFNKADNFQPLQQVIQILHRYPNIEILFEPGASISREAGYLVSEVLDMFVSDGKQIAILDTTVNHMPEVFEYQFKPNILNEDKSGLYPYILAGSSCLAGDLFGEYRFNQPLRIGSRVIFTGAGSYTMVKAHYFNGINLPAIYTFSESGGLALKKIFTFNDYLLHCGAT